MDLLDEEDKAEEEAAKAAAEAKQKRDDLIKNFMDQKTPEEVFEQFDLDGSGSIDFQEFKEMLPKMGVEMSEAKALRFFRNCDIARRDC